jgi:hypothetical protein
MRVRSSVWHLLAALFAAALVSCSGGGGGSGAAAVPSPAGPAAQGNLLFPQSGGSVDLPPTAGITSTMFVAGNGAAPPTPAEVATSTTLLAEYGIGATSGQLVPQTLNIPRTPVWYLYFTSYVTQTVPGLPGFQVSVPEGVTTAGKQFFLAFYDGTKWNYGVEGPATIKNNQILLTGTHTPFTFIKGVQYVYEIYSQPIVNPIVTNPTSLTLKPGQSSTFQITETGYNGAFTIGMCTSGSTTIATVSPSTANGPSATVTVTGVVNGTCTIAIADTYGQTASENVTVNLPPLVVTPSSLTLNGNTQGSFTVSETGYAGTFSIGTCTQSSQTIATASPTTANGPSANITVTPVKGGSCTMAVSDTNGQTTNETITVNVSALTISPTALQFATAPSAQTQSVTISETNYNGAFTYTACKQGATTVATLTPASISGPSATLTVASQAVGNCTVMVSDTLGQSGTFTVGVTAANFTINSVKRH